MFGVVWTAISMGSSRLEYLKMYGGVLQDLVPIYIQSQQRFIYFYMRIERHVVFLCSDM